MKLPRAVSGDELAAALVRAFGYIPTRQVGSHARLTCRTDAGEHHVTVPRHDALHVGTFARIINDVAMFHQLDRQTVIGRLFPR